MLVPGTCVSCYTTAVLTNSGENAPPPASLHVINFVICSSSTAYRSCYNDFVRSLFRSFVSLSVFCCVCQGCLFYGWTMSIVCEDEARCFMEI